MIFHWTLRGHHQITRDDLQSWVSPHPGNDSWVHLKIDEIYPCSPLLHIHTMIFQYNIFLVGGIPTPLKNMKVSWDDYSQYMEEI